MTTDEAVTMQKAAAILGVSHSKMWLLVRDGILSARPNPLDRREKLVRLSDVQHLKGADQRPRPRTAGALSDSQLRSDQIDEWLEANWHPC